MSVVRNHEYAISGNCHATIRAARYSSADSFGATPLIMPDGTAGACVERIALVGAGDIHNALHHYGSHLKIRAIGDWKDPVRGQPRDVGGVDRGEFAESISARVAVVGWPVVRRNYWTVAIV